MTTSKGWRQKQNPSRRQKLISLRMWALTKLTYKQIKSEAIGEKKMPTTSSPKEKSERSHQTTIPGNW